MNDDGTNLDRLIGKLIAQHEAMSKELYSIGSKLDEIAHTNNHRSTLIESRVMSLEMKWAENRGGNKVAALVFGSAAAIGGLIVTVLTKLWSG